MRPTTAEAVNRLTRSNARRPISAAPCGSAIIVDNAVARPPDVAGSHEHAGDAVLDEIHDPTARGGDDRAAGRHGLEHDRRARIEGPRRHDDDARRPHQRDDVAIGENAEQLGAVGHLQPGLGGHSAGEQERGCTGEPAVGLQEHLDALAAGEVPGVQQRAVDRSAPGRSRTRSSGMKFGITSLRAFPSSPVRDATTELTAMKAAILALRLRDPTKFTAATAGPMTGP